MAPNDKEIDWRSRQSIFGKNKTKLTLDEIQKRIFQNKKNKGFNVTDVNQELSYLIAEFGEMAEGIKNPEREDLVEAAVDMCIFAFGLFEIYRVSAYDFVVRKMLVNEKRSFRHTHKDYFVRKNRDKRSEINDIELPKNLSKLDLNQIQKRILANKKDKGFNLNPDNIEMEFVNLGEEISEMFVALRRGEDQEFLDALADVFIYNIGIMGIMELDSYELITKKMNHNEKRIYLKSKSGRFIRKDQL